jgi:hypothetical protein
MLSFAEFLGTSRYGAAAEQVNYQDHQRDDQQQVNQTARHVEAET